MKKINNKFLMLGLLFLPACSAIVGPRPTQESEWPFGDKNHVTIKSNDFEKLGKVDANPENKIEIFDDTPFDRYEIADKDGIQRGNIWFKKGPNDYIGYAFSIPNTDEDKLKHPPHEEELTHAIYSRAKFVKQNDKTKIIIEALGCDEATKEKSHNCEFKTVGETWNAVFSALKPNDKNDIIDFELVK